jgi:hypothetical protein
MHYQLFNVAIFKNKGKIACQALKSSIYHKTKDIEVAR